MWGDGLSKKMRHHNHAVKIEPVELDERTRLVDLVEQFSRTSFQSRNLYRAFRVFEKMETDDDRPIIFLTLAGAMVPAGMKGVINEMMRRCMVDVIISTGANVIHDVVEACGYSHYAGDANADDTQLRKDGIVRIYDTYLPEEGFVIAGDLVQVVARSFGPRRVSSRLFIEELGKHLKSQDSFVATAVRLGVPIFVPALNDSDIGIQLTKYYVDTPPEERMTIDPIRDNYEVFQIFAKAKKTGIIIIGGGVPRNYGQQLSVIEELIANKPTKEFLGMGHNYGVLITTDDPKWGGLSGCTFSESISWGKYSIEANTAEVYCDATIAWPILVGAVMQKAARKLAEKPRCKFVWDDDKLVELRFEKPVYLQEKELK